MPPPIVLPMTSMSGSNPPLAGDAARAGADRVGLVVDEDRPVAARELAHALEVAGVGQHDPDVRQRRLDEQRRDLPVRERAVERLEVVERHDARGQRRVDLPARGCRAAQTDPIAPVDGRGRRTSRRPSRDSSTRGPRRAGRPVIARASRSENRFASVAVSVNCHDGSPNRRASSSPTQAASSVGSIVVMPRRSCRSTAAITGAGP